MRFSLLSGDEIQQFKQRMAIVFAALAVCIAILVFRLFYLQVFQGGYYDEVATGNRIRVVPREAPRGLIYDRNGELLAYNRPAFNIDLIAEDSPNLDRSLKNLARVSEQPYELLKEASQTKKGPRFKAVTLLKDVGRTTADLVDTYEEDLPGVSVAVEAKRLYPTAALTSHVLGYVGAINEDQLEKVSARQIFSARIVGQAGIELMQNDALIGVDGGKQVEVNHVGRELREMSKAVNPIPGNDLYLSIDLRLQRELRRLLEGKVAVALVMKPRTGEVLGMISLPDYDPNTFVGGVSQQSWAELTQSPQKPLVNKALQGVYPPGSTFKMMIALAALDAGLIDENTVFHCPGYFRMGRDIRYCWKHSGHGDVTVREAIEKSCNVFFYNVGLLLGVDRIRDYGVQFGFSQTTGIELESEKSGLLPSKEWKLRTLKEKWYDGETLPVVIGQGFVTVTPIQLLNYVNTIANRGLWVRPTIIHQVVAADGREVISASTLPRHTRLMPIAPKYFDMVREAMTWVVNRAGTGGRAQSKLFNIAGKTGTSQVVGRKAGHAEERNANDENQPHSLFVGFAPAEDPLVSVLVLVEHGQHGGATAAPLARQILEFYSKHIEPLDQPVAPGSRPIGPAEQFIKELNDAFPEPAPDAQ